MEQIDSEKAEKILLSDRRVVAEIERHLWIESEKVGFDIGFDQAKVDWFNRFSHAWMEYHMPDQAARFLRKDEDAAGKPAFVKEQEVESKTSIKRRRAKSYFK